MKVTTICLACTAAAAVLLCHPGASRAADVASIEVGDVSPTAPNWPSFVAEDEGFYRKAGVAPKVTYVGNVADRKSVV